MKKTNFIRRKFIQKIFAIILLPVSVSQLVSKSEAKTFAEEIDGFINLKDFLTNDDWLDCNSNEPKNDHSYALNNALKKGNKIYLPPVKGCYLFQEVKVPTGAILKGNVELPYTVKSINDIKGSGSAISFFSKGKNIFKVNNHVTFSGLVFFGNRYIDGVVSDTGKKISNVRIDACGFYNFRVGIGSLTNYIKIDVRDCISSSNKIGLANVVDSKITTSTFNSNSQFGIALNKGANDNILSELKVEWNGINNLFIAFAVNNIVSTSIFDRAGKAGLYISNAELVLNSIVIRRSGGIAKQEADSTHLYIVNSNLIITGVLTKKGRNDDGKGKLSPNYSIYIDDKNKSGSIIVSDSDLSGVIISPIYNKVEASIKIRNSIL
ncbi:hypothetical protein SB6411_01854 [Klebsiella spallanzanii]|uniref:Uncharacterized protein n=1 Tax=Klebsiella spallanzanii TaxID=2587528 RepID=A0ABY6VG92_9ENTR|nr:hypothetical protein [Klebsiella spallanzanii]VUS60327.1 hypothetical protein SB6411_01854 [Klebsiella spallanzanii]